MKVASSSRSGLSAGIARETLSWLALAMLALLLAGVLSYGIQRSMIRKNALEQASMVADLKVNQLRSLLDGQRAMAMALSHGTVLALNVEDWIHTGKIPPKILERLQLRLLTAQTDQHYRDVDILSSDGRVLLTCNNPDFLPSMEDRQAIAEALLSGTPQITSLYLDNSRSGQPPALDVASPMIAVDEHGSRTVAIMLLRLDPEKFIFPYLQQWPIFSTTAETLIAEQRGDRIYFLNELRHRKGIALRISVAMTETQRLVVQAALGKTGLLQGVDYRNVPVLGASRPIPGTSWILVAKEDKAEFYRPLLMRTLVMTMVGFCFLMAVILGGRAWMRQRNTVLLRERELRYRELFESMADAFFLVDPEGCFLEVNQVAVDQLGYSREELLGMGPAEITHPKFRAIVPEIHSHLRREGKVTFENLHMRKDGSTFPVEIHSRRLVMEGAELVLSIGRDITDRKAAEEEIRNSQARMRAVFENAGVGIAVTDLEGRYIEVNPKLAGDLGYSREEMLQRTTQQTLHPEDREKSKRLLDGLLRDDANSALIEKRFLRKDGSIVWALVAITPIRDAQGAVHSFVKMLIDITERKRIEGELVLTSERLSIATQGAGIGIWDRDVVTGNLVWDDEMYRLFGMRREDVASADHAWRVGLHPEDANQTREAFQAALRGESEYAPEFRICWPDGSVHTLKAAAKTLHDESGWPVRMVGINFDITARKQAERALEESMARLRVILSNLYSGVLVISVDNNVELINPFMCELFEIPDKPQKIEGTTCEYIREKVRSKFQDADHFEGRVEELIARGEIVHDEEMRLTNGKVILRDFIPVTMNGKVTGRVWTHRDITALRQAEESRRVEDERLRAMMVLYDASALSEREIMEIAIEEMARLVGASISYLHFVNPDQESISLGAWNREAKKDCKAVAENHYPLNQAGVWADSLRQRRPVIHNDYQALPDRQGYPDGHMHLLNHLSVPVFDGDQVVAIGGVGNKPGGFSEEDARQLRLFLGGMWNLIRRKRAELQVVESEQFLRTVADSMPGVVAYWTRDLICTFANTKHLEWFGRSAQEMVGMDVMEFMGQDGYREAQSRFLGVLSGEKQTYRRTVQKPDGSAGTLWGYYIPDFAEGEVRGFYVVASDITELQEAHLVMEQLNRDLEERTRQAESANRAKSDFLANMSHEIRTPMNAIMGLSHLVLRTELNTRQHDYLSRIQTASRSLLALLNDILDLSKIEAEKLEIEYAPFNLHQVVEQVSGILSEKAQEKGLAVCINLPTEIPVELMGDSLRLGQVLLNLASNAVKFTEQGYVTLAVEQLAQEAGQLRLRFTVADTGIGIDPEVLPRLFQSFSQADASTTRRFGGSGLGLTICKRLVELMGGEITVQSELGKGSVFAFTLSLMIRKDVKIFAQQLELAGELHGRKVLVVDDEPDAARLAKLMLESLGLVADTCHSGADAVAELVAAERREDPYEVVLMDWRMPGMDGLKAAHAIREEKRIQHKPAMVLLTAYGGEGMLRSAEAQPLDGVLLKPVSASLLYDMVAEILSRRCTPESKARNASQPAHEARLQPARILLAEDNETNRMVAVEMLRDAGFLVETAVNGQQAVEKALAPLAGFDLILMDVQMPGMDGLEATSLIRKTLPDLPILAMTAQAMESERKLCIAAGMNDHLSKPFEPEELLRRLNRWIPTERRGAKEIHPVPAVRLESLNREALLARCGGDARKADLLLEAVSRDLIQNRDTLRQAVEAQDRTLAGHVGHNLKGMAGMVSAPHLQEAAALLNEAAIQEADWCDVAIKLEKAITALLQTVPTAPGKPAEPGSGDDQEAQVQIQELYRLLQRRSLSARAKVESLGKVLNGESGVARLQSEVRNLDFEAALTTLAELAQARGLFLTGGD